MELYDALEKWVMQRSGGSVEERIKEIAEAISSIRYLTMDIRTLCDLPLLTPEERLALISNQFLMDETFTPLPMPEGFSISRKKR